MTKATKWEYRYEYVRAETNPGGMRSPNHDPDAVRDALNRAGERGWELVSMEPHWSNSIGVPFIQGWYMTFKRPKPVDDGPNAEKI